MSRLQFVDCLRFISSRQLTGGFQFHNDFAKTNKISAIAALQKLPFISDGQNHFALKRNLPGRQFHRQSLLINSFQKTVAKLAMHFHRRAYNRISLRVFVWFLKICVHLRNLRTPYPPPTRATSRTFSSNAAMMACSPVKPCDCTFFMDCSTRW